VPSAPGGHGLEGPPRSRPAGRSRARGVGGVRRTRTRAQARSPVPVRRGRRVARLGGPRAGTRHEELHRSDRPEAQTLPRPRPVAADRHRRAAQTLLAPRPREAAAGIAWLVGACASRREARLEGAGHADRAMRQPLRRHSGPRRTAPLLSRGTRGVRVLEPHPRAAPSPEAVPTPHGVQPAGGCRASDPPHAAGRGGGAAAWSEIGGP